MTVDGELYMLTLPFAEDDSKVEYSWKKFLAEKWAPWLRLLSL